MLDIFYTIDNVVIFSLSLLSPHSYSLSLSLSLSLHFPIQYAGISHTVINTNIQACTHTRTPYTRTRTHTHTNSVCGFHRNLSWEVELQKPETEQIFLSYYSIKPMLPLLLHLPNRTCSTSLNPIRCHIF